MISQVSLGNFKSLRDVQIDLDRFTVFVGPNASGKSSILQGLDLLCRAFQKPHPNLPQSPQQKPILTELSEAMSRCSRGSIELVCKIGDTKYRLLIDATMSMQAANQVPRGPWDGSGRGIMPNRVGSVWEQWSFKQNDPIPLPRSVLLHLEASKLVQPTFALPDPTVMAADGTGLHTALASMALNDPDSWQTLQADLRRIIPSIRRLRHTRTANLNEPASLLFDAWGADSLPANQVSEGTLLVLGLLAALHASGRPSLVLLDDLDRGLHPKAQMELISLLRGLLQTNPGLQILATTHSPYMLDCMEPKEVRMTFLPENGASVCAALASHPEFEKWKDEMTPGEMWSLFGEKWTVEQGAKA